MMTYPGTWKTVLILSHSFDTSRILFMVPTIGSLWDVNPATEQTSLKVSGLVSGRWVLLMSSVQADHPLLACIHHPQLEQSCHYVQNQSYIICYYLAEEQEGLDNEGLWQKEHRDIEHCVCSCNLFLIMQK